MVTKTNNQRLRSVKLLIGLALIAAIVGLATFSYREGAKAPSVNAEKIFPQFDQGFFEKVARIRITVPDGSFNIVKTESQSWIMPERGNFPISQSTLKRFESEIKRLAKLEVRTNDPSQFDRLGVGESKEFGEGTAIEFFDAGGQIIAGYNIGQIGGLIFARKLGAMEVYSVSGQLMPISQKAAWLDFDFLKIPKGSIAEVDVKPKSANSYTIRQTADGRFQLANGETGPRIDNIGQFVSDIEPTNLTSASRIDTAPLLTETIRLTDGSTIIVNLYRHFDSHWVKLEAVNTGAPSKLLAAQFSAKTEEWAFAIADDAAEQLLQSKPSAKLRGRVTAE